MARALLASAELPENLMLTLRNAPLETVTEPREHSRAQRKLAYGLALWAVAMLCLAMLGHASSVALGPESWIASVAPGLL